MSELETRHMAAKIAGEIKTLDKGRLANQPKAQLAHEDSSGIVLISVERDFFQKHNGITVTVHE